MGRYREGPEFFEAGPPSLKNLQLGVESVRKSRSKSQYLDRHDTVEILLF